MPLPYFYHIYFLSRIILYFLAIDNIYFVRACLGVILSWLKALLGDRKHFFFFLFLSVLILNAKILVNGRRFLDLNNLRLLRNRVLGKGRKNINYY